MSAFTLFDLAGRKLIPPSLAEATLVLIDYQNTYLAGPLALVDAQQAVARTKLLLDAARAAGGRTIHVAHKGAPGGFSTARKSAVLSLPHSHRLWERPLSKGRARMPFPGPI